MNPPRPEGLDGSLSGLKAGAGVDCWRWNRLVVGWMIIMDGTALCRGRFLLIWGQKGRPRLSFEEIERSPGAVLGLAIALRGKKANATDKQRRRSRELEVTIR